MHFFYLSLFRRVRHVRQVENFVEYHHIYFNQFLLHLPQVTLHLRALHLFVYQHLNLFQVLFFVLPDEGLNFLIPLIEGEDEEA